MTASINFASLKTYTTHALDPSLSLINIYYNKAQNPENKLPYWTQGGYLDYAHQQLIKNTNQVAQSIFEKIKKTAESGKNITIFSIETNVLQEHRELYQQLFQELFANSCGVKLTIRIAPNPTNVKGLLTRITCHIAYIPLN